MDVCVCVRPIRTGLEYSNKNMERNCKMRLNLLENGSLRTSIRKYIQNRNNKSLNM